MSARSRSSAALRSRNIIDLVNLRAKAATRKAKRSLVIFLYIWMWAVLVEVHQWILLRQVGGAVTLGFAFFNALDLAGRSYWSPRI